MLVEEIVATGMHLSIAKDFIFNFASKNSFCLPKRFYTFILLKELSARAVVYEENMISYSIYRSGLLEKLYKIIDENSKSYVEGGE